MKIVYVNNLGYLQGPSVRDATKPVEVSDDLAEELSSWPSGKLWQYNETTQKFNLVVSFDLFELRLTRQVECFPVINRGYLWYKTLTETQQVELQDWYQAWLDVTETGILPTKPEWLQ
jgi:hypothetical protein